MHDIKFIRNNSELFDNFMKKRGLGAVAAEILKRDKQVREIKSELQKLQCQSNDFAKKIGLLKSQKKDKEAEEAIKMSIDVKAQIAALKEKQEVEDNDESNELLDSLLLTFPNILSDDVPEGSSEDDNVLIRNVGEMTDFSFHPKEHYELGENLDMMDFKQAAKISGSRFVILKDKLALMERILGQFMLDIHTKEFGYEEISPPLLVRDEAMFGSGQLPKFAEESFAVLGDYRLVPTAEVPLVNIVSDRILSKKELPLRYVAYTPSFRSEAGAAGRDTRGMIRLHQFWKVELVSITDKESSSQELERKLNCAEEILKRLKLPYRVVLLCSQDTSFSSSKTYDLEVWMPGQLKYREVSSCSNCTDFQARRMKSRYRDNNEVFHTHTLNGSGVAVGRVLAAILENYQNEDGSINIPEVLQPYMNINKIDIKE